MLAVASIAQLPAPELFGELKKKNQKVESEI